MLPGVDGLDVCRILRRQSDLSVLMLTARSTEDDCDPEVEVDPVRLRQAVGNLVANALRHTPTGGAVTVSGSVTGQWVVIDVADTGVGISAADLPRVFDRFWRAEKSEIGSPAGPAWASRSCGNSPRPTAAPRP